MVRYQCLELSKLSWLRWITNVLCTMRVVKRFRNGTAWSELSSLRRNNSARWTTHILVRRLEVLPKKWKKRKVSILNLLILNWQGKKIKILKPGKNLCYVTLHVYEGIHTILFNWWYASKWSKNHSEFSCFDLITFVKCMKNHNLECIRSRFPHLHFKR